MKMQIKYQCEYCFKEYDNAQDAYQCEADCLKLTLDEYGQYRELLKNEKEAFGQAACIMNDEIRNRCDNAVEAVLLFQKEHGITDDGYYKRG